MSKNNNSNGSANSNVRSKLTSLFGFELFLEEAQTDLLGHDGVSTPSIIISADDIFSSRMSGYEKFAPCHRWSDIFYREVGGTATARLSGSGRMCADGVPVAVAEGSHSATIISKVQRGDMVAKITFNRMTSINNECVPIKTEEFKNAQFVDCVNLRGITFFMFRFDEVTITYIDFNQDGEKIGQNAVTLNFKTWVVS